MTLVSWKLIFLLGWRIFFFLFLDRKASTTLQQAHTMQGMLQKPAATARSAAEDWGWCLLWLHQHTCPAARVFSAHKLCPFAVYFNEKRASCLSFTQNKATSPSILTLQLFSVEAEGFHLLRSSSCLRNQAEWVQGENKKHLYQKCRCIHLMA